MIIKIQDTELLTFSSEWTLIEATKVHYKGHAEDLDGIKVFKVRYETLKDEYRELILVCPVTVYIMENGKTVEVRRHTRRAKRKVVMKFDEPSGLYGIEDFFPTTISGEEMTQGYFEGTEQECLDWLTDHEDTHVLVIEQNNVHKVNVVELIND